MISSQVSSSMPRSAPPGAPVPMLSPVCAYHGSAALLLSPADPRPASALVLQHVPPAGRAAALVAELPAWLAGLAEAGTQRHGGLTSSYYLPVFGRPGPCVAPPPGLLPLPPFGGLLGGGVFFGGLDTILSPSALACQTHQDENQHRMCRASCRWYRRCWSRRRVGCCSPCVAPTHHFGAESVRCFRHGIEGRTGAGEGR